jgi:putative oxidoreductase
MTMTNTVEDQQRSPFAPEPHSGRRAPTLPAPPDFDDEPTRVQPVAEAPDATPAEDAPVAPEHQGGEEASAAEEYAPTDQLLLDEPVAEQLPPEDSLHADATAVMATPQLSPEEQKLADERAARREAREQALAAADTPTVAQAEPVVVTRRSTDQFLGASALFLLRLVVAAIMAVRGLEIVTNLGATEALLATTLIPEPRIMAMVIGGAALAIAVALVFGLLTRVAGLGVTLITGGALAFVLWGNWSPFVPGRPGFIGELELLLAVVGLVFLMIGGGGFSLDRSFRKSREKDRLAAQVG